MTARDGQKPVSLFMDEDLKAWLKVEASGMNMSLSAYLRYVIERWREWRDNGGGIEGGAVEQVRRVQTTEDTLTREALRDVADALKLFVESQAQPPKRSGWRRWIPRFGE